MKTNIRKIVLLQIVFLCLCSSAWAVEYGHGYVNVFYYDVGWPDSDYNIGFYTGYNGSHYDAIKIYSGNLSTPNTEGSTYVKIYGAVCSEQRGWVKSYDSGSGASPGLNHFVLPSNFTLVDAVDGGSGYPDTYYPDTSNLQCNGLPEPEPDPCEDVKGRVVNKDKFLNGRFTKDFCSFGCKATSTGPFDMSYKNSDDEWVTSISQYTYTGTSCEEGEQDYSEPEKDPADPSDPEEKYPYDYFCSKMKKNCSDLCSGGLTPNFTCDPETGDYVCECANPLYPSDPTPTPDDMIPVEGETDAEGATETDKADLRNQSKLLEQGEDIKDLLSSHGSNLESIVDNTGKLVESIGSGQLGSGIADGVEKGMRGALDGVEDGLGDIEGSLDGIKDGLGEGTYTQEAIPEEIVPSPEEIDFGARTEQFLKDMSECSLFSVVDGLDDLSGSGSPTISIDGGETFGSHVIDFSAFDSGLNALRYVFHLMGMIIGLRILTLKR